MANQKIDALIPVPGKNTVCVRSGEFEYEVAGSSVDKFGLQPGKTISTALRKQLEAAAHRRAAAAKALTFLNGRPRTEYEVRQYLLDNDHSDLAVTAVLEELRVQGLVDDQRYAEWYVQARLAHRPTGVVRLVHEMLSRGVPRELAQPAAEAVVTERDEESLAMQAAKKRLPTLQNLDTERAMRRLSSFLTGRGFRQGTVRSVCLKLLEGHGVQAPSGRFA